MRTVFAVVVMMMVWFAPATRGQAPYKYKRLLVNVAEGSDARECIDMYLRQRWDWRIKDFRCIDSYYAFDRAGMPRMIRRYYVLARKKHADWEK